MHSAIPPLEPNGHYSGPVVDRIALLGGSRMNLGQPNEVAKVNVNQWRVAIPRILQRTGLDFGAKVRGADTISDVQQWRTFRRKGMNQQYRHDRIYYAQNTSVDARARMGAPVPAQLHSPKQNATNSTKTTQT